MKKFMTIAMIVLAAAMLVVSCDANKKADVDHSVLVNATLGVSEAKALVGVTSATNANVRAIKVRITPQWQTLREDSEEPAYYGNLENAEHTATKKTTGTDVYTLSTETFNLGYISQGLWKVEVWAYSDNGATPSKLVYNGEGTFFFAPNTASHAVVLSESTNNGTQVFTFNTIKTPAYIDGTKYSLSVFIDNEEIHYVRTSATDDYVKACTTATDYSSAETYFTKSGDVYTKVGTSTPTDWNNYYVANTSMTDWYWEASTPTDAKHQKAFNVGSHTYRVVFSNDTPNGNKVGGVSGRFYLAQDNATAFIEGDLAKGDFVQSTLSFVVEGYEIKIYDGETLANTLVTTTATNASAYKTFTAKATAETGSVNENLIKWYLDGDDTAVATGVTYNLPLNTTAPGYHHITAMYDNMAFYRSTVKVLPSATQQDGNL